MKYIFEINIYTDGDFYLPFVPTGMKYDGDYEYTFKKYYRDRDEAIKDIVDICTFLKENMLTSRNYVRDTWNARISSFLKKLNKSSQGAYERVEEYMFGNYEGTEFIFYVEAEKFQCDFCLTDEEAEIIKSNKRLVTIGDVKKAILELYKR